MGDSEKVHHSSLAFFILESFTQISTLVFARRNIILLVSTFPTCLIFYILRILSCPASQGHIYNEEKKAMKKILV